MTPRRRLRIAPLVATLVVASQLAACSLPFTKSKDERKAECDRIAARAIQTGSVGEAKDLAARASECYARVQGD